MPSSITQDYFVVSSLIFATDDMIAAMPHNITLYISIWETYLHVVLIQIQTFQSGKHIYMWCLFKCRHFNLGNIFTCGAYSNADISIWETFTCMWCLFKCRYFNLGNIYMCLFKCRHFNLGNIYMHVVLIQMQIFQSGKHLHVFIQMQTFQSGKHLHVVFIQIQTTKVTG